MNKQTTQESKTIQKKQTKHMKLIIKHNRKPNKHVQQPPNMSSFYSSKNCLVYNVWFGCLFFIFFAKYIFLYVFFLFSCLVFLSIAVYKQIKYFLQQNWKTIFIPGWCLVGSQGIILNPKNTYNECTTESFKKVNDTKKSN